jgi:predicted SnoaL-like aldol condensation-catalyzing enzyme
MKISIECTPEEANDLPKLMGVDKTIEELAQEAITIKKNKEALFRFQKEVFNGHDWSIETLSKHLTDDFIDHAAMPGDLPGLEGVQSRFSYWNSAFQDAEEEDIEVSGQGDLVAVLYNLHARHGGTYMGIEATNQPVVIPGIEFVRFRDGKICEHWGIYDFMSTAEEIGADLTFTPKAIKGVPKRPEAAWKPEVTTRSKPASD